MKKHLALGLLVAFLASFAITPATAAPYVPVGFSPDSDRQAVTIEDMADGPDWTSLISNSSAVRKGESTLENPHICQSLTTNGCKLDGSVDLDVSAILPKCVDAQNNCVEGLKITKPDGTVVDTKFLKMTPGFRFDGIPERDLPGGETPSIWVAEGAKNSAGSEKYVVVVSLVWRLESGNYRITNMTARVVPIKDVYGDNFRPSEISYHVNPNTQKFQINIDNGEQGGLDLCVATDVGYCAQRVDFVPETRATLTLRLTNKVTGWLHGRISRPDISVTPIDTKYNRLSIAGSAVEVPTMYAEFEKSKMTPEFMNYFKSQLRLGGFNGKSEWYEFNASLPKAREVIKTLAGAANDTASGSNSYWSVKSITADSSNNSCLKDTSKLVGLVTTNAMAYSGEAPQWVGGTLRYEVAGLHFMPDGKTPAEGTYDLAIRSDVARCLYGFSKAPIYGEISVTGSNGEAKVATTKVFESDGWLKLSAYGFTFSSPTISVKLSQAKVATKTTITCVKGKLTKKVTAVGPKCPAGYKKK